MDAALARMAEHVKEWQDLSHLERMVVVWKRQRSDSEVEKLLVLRAIFVSRLKQWVEDIVGGS